MLFFPYYLLAEWLCFFAAVLLLKRDNKFWQALRYYLGFVVFQESIDYYLVWVVHIKSNHWLTNCCILVEYGFSMWIFSKLIKMKGIGKICTIGYILFLLSYLVEYDQKGFFSFFNKADTVGSEAVIVICMIYYYTLFRKEDETYSDLLNDPLFWFISGSFIYYSTSICLDTFFQKLVEIRIGHKVSLRYITMNVLNMVLYGFWIKSFLCIRGKQIYT